MTTKHLGKRVRKAREARDLTRKELTDRHPQVRSKNFLDQIERDKSLPSVDTLAWLCAELNVSADWLLGLSKRGGP